MNARLFLAAVLLAGPVHAEPRTDAHGDPLPDGAVARFGTVRYRAGFLDVIRGFGVSADGKTLATSGRDRVTLRDTESGRIVREFSARPIPVDRVVICRFALAADGKRMARSVGGAVAAWDLTTGKLLFDIDFGDEEEIEGLAWPPGKDELAVLNGHGGELCRLDGRTGRRLSRKELDGSTQWLSPSGRLAVSGADPDIFVFDTATGKARCHFADVEHPAPPAFAADEDGIYLVAGNRLLVHDTRTGRRLEAFDTPADWYDSTWAVRLSVAADGSIAYVSRHERPILRLDLKARRWLDPIPCSDAANVVPSPDPDQLLLLTHEGVLRRFDRRTLREVPTTPGFDGSPYAEPSPDGRAVAVRSGLVDGRLERFDLSGRSLWNVKSPAGMEPPVWSPDGRWLACPAENEVAIHDAATGRAVRTVRPDRDAAVADAWFSPDSARLVVRSAAEPRPVAFDVKTGERVELRADDTRGPANVSPDGRHRVAGRGGPGVRLVEAATGKALTEWTDPEPKVRFHTSRPVFSPDGTYVLSFDRSKARADRPEETETAVIRDPTTLARKRTFGLGISRGSEFALSPNGLWLAAGDEVGRLVMWDVATGQRLGTWAGHREYLSRVAFVGIGRVLTASHDLTALLWDLRPTQKPTRPAWDALAGSDGPDAWRAVWSLAADPSGPELLRAKVVLEKPSEVVQARAVAAMELAGSAEAKKLLAEWAAGAPGARLKADARAALDRMAAR